jgi:uncharacterized tellurite resistance protein B-like protein
MSSTFVTPVEMASAVGVHESAHGKPQGWFTRAVTRYMRANLERLRGVTPAIPKAGEGIPDLARSKIQRAALVSAGGGALTGTISTAATVVTAQTEGMAGFVAVPLAALAMGLEVVWRTAVHVRLTCDLAHLFQVRVDLDDADDLLRLYALAFGTHDEGDEKDLGQGTLERITEAESEDVGERIGRAVVGESVMRNVLPFVGIITSAVTNYRVTQKLGDTVRRYMRYQRAMSDAIAHAELTCERSKLLLIEGMWFIFTADGLLQPEEAACLSHLLSDLTADERTAVRARFTDDEIDWMTRVQKEVPSDMRDAFLYALEVAASLDKEVSLPERKILKRVAMMFGKELKLERLTAMIEDFEANGVLTPPEELTA